MKESLLWKRINNRFREKIKSRINSESGSALVLAVYFMFAVVAVTSVVAAVLVSLTAPLKNNTKRSEAAYAAEAGLQAGLTYLRQLESDSSAELFPTETADLGNNNYYKASVDNIGASGAKIDVVKVKTSQPSYTAQTTSYTDDFKYETEIEFFKNDPNGTEPLQLATERKDAKYAVVVSRAYYADGKNESETRSMSGTYMFGAKAIPGSGGGKQGSAFDVATSYTGRNTTQPIWPAFLPEAKSNLTVDTKTGAISGTVNLGGNDNGVKGEDSYYSVLDRTMHPGNSTCVIATSYNNGSKKAAGISKIEDLFDTNTAPSEGSAVLILPNAYKKNPGVNDWTFNPLCQSGQYEKFNSFSYNEDGTITLAGTNLCITGYKGTDRSAEKHVARLESCGTSDNEKLSNMQVWAFNVLFINAEFGFDESGTIRLAKEGEQVDLEKKSSYFQDLEGTNPLPISDIVNFINGSSVPDAVQHGAGGDIKDVKSDKYYMLTVRGWSNNLHGTILDQNSDSEEISTTLGSGGPAGNKTDRIVNAETGMCLHNQSGTAIVKNCNVNIGPLYPYCWKHIIASGNDNKLGYGSPNSYCPYGYQQTNESYFKNDTPPTDTFKYTEVASGTSGSISISDGYGNDPFNWGSVTRENGVNNQYTIKKNGQCLAVIKPGYYYDSNRTNRAYEYMSQDFLNNRNYAKWIDCSTKLYDYYGREVQNAMNWNAPISNGGGSGGGGTDPVEGSSGYQLTKEIAIGTKWNV
ncbi:MAG: hypothetical protein U0L31_02670 [Bifidobacteriaceae bacterium]|nr:hypothetical protein [Bifidobacteriaceae bacterium]